MKIPMGILLNNLLSLFLMMTVGFVIVRKKLVPASATGILNTILMKVALPSMLFVSMIRPFEKSFLKDLLIMLLCSFSVLLFLIFLSIPLAKLFGAGKDHEGVWELCVSFSNNGFMGFPIISSVLGETGLAMAVVFNIAQNVLIYSAGAKLLQRGIGGDSGKNAFSWKKVLFTMINLSMLLGIICYTAGYTPPDFILSPLQHLNNLTTPLSMILVGMHIGAGSFKETVGDRDAVIGTAVKLILMPAIIWLALKPIPFTNSLIPKVLLLIVSMPTASITGILAQDAGGDVKLASRLTFFSTSLCFLSIPLICLLP